MLVTEHPAVLAALPEFAKYLAEKIGLSALLDLVAAYGGSTFPIPIGRDRPEGLARLAMLEEVVGHDAAAILVKNFKETEIYIPLCTNSLRIKRNMDIQAEFDEATGRGASALRAVADIARKYRVSDRQVWRILNTAY